DIDESPHALAEPLEQAHELFAQVLGLLTGQPALRQQCLDQEAHAGEEHVPVLGLGRERFAQSQAQQRDFFVDAADRACLIEAFALRRRETALVERLHAPLLVVSLQARRQRLASLGPRSKRWPSRSSASRASNSSRTVEAPALVSCRARNTPSARRSATTSYARSA